MLGQRVGLQELEALPGVVAVDLLHVELAHERDDLLRDDLARHHDREAGRIRDHELRRDQLRALGEPLVDLLALELDVLDVGGVVGHVVRLAHVPFLGGALRVVAEGVVEALEVGQVRHVLDQRLHPRRKAARSVPAALGEPLVDRPRHVGEGLDQVREVAPRVVDVDLDEHAVARGLVDLDVVLAGEQRLELGAVVPRGAAEQRDPGRIEVELVVVQRADRVASSSSPARPSR